MYIYKFSHPAKNYVDYAIDLSRRLKNKSYYDL